MPTSVAMPDVKVEVAWNAGFNTPAASRTWTDISDYVELSPGINITHGRQDQRSVADANSLSLTLDNRDGRFTAGLASSPYYPNVKLYRPIRVTATTVAGDGSVTSTRFTGYVTQWPLDWDGTDAYAYAQVTASSRLQRLGLNRAWKSIIEQNVLVDAPVAYYTLGEPEGATMANESSGKGGSPLVPVGAGADVSFGVATGPGTDGLTAATFSGGKYLSTNTVSIPNGPTSLELFFNIPAAAASDRWMGALTDSSDLGFRLGMNSLGRIIAQVGDPFGVSYSAGTSTSFADGLTHHAILTHNGGTTLTLYVDGVSYGTAVAPLAHGTLTKFSAGGYGVSAATAPITGVVAHVAAYTSELSATRATAHANAGLLGFAGETTDARFTRLTTLAGIPSAEVSAEAGSTTMAFVDTTDQQVVDLLRSVEGTEAGVMFDDRDGTLRLHNRGHRYATSAIYTLNMAQHMVEADFSPVMDNSVIFNDVSVANVAGTYSAHVIDTTSVTDYGVNAVSAETASENPDEPLSLANWWVYAYKDPRTRVPTLAVDVLAQVGKSPNSAAVLATNVGDKITVSNQPSQAAASTASYFVEGYTETWGPESCRMTFNVSPDYPESTVLIVDDPVYGAVDTYAVAL